MFVLNVNTDTDTRLLIHSVIDLLNAKKVRRDYLKHMLNLSKKVCEDLDKYIINRKNVLLADSNEKDKEKILGSDFIDTCLKLGFNIDNMHTRLECTENN